MKRYDFASLFQLASVPEETQSRLLEILDLASRCGYPPLVVGLYPIRAGAAQWFDAVVSMPPEKHLITRLLLLEQLGELEPPPPEPNLYAVCLHIARSYREPQHGWSVESLLSGDCGLSATRVFITLFQLHSATLERLRTFTYHEFGDYQMIAALTPRFVLPQLEREGKIVRHDGVYYPHPQIISIMRMRGSVDGLFADIIGDCLFLARQLGFPPLLFDWGEIPAGADAYRHALITLPEEAITSVVERKGLHPTLISMLYSGDKL